MRPFVWLLSLLLLSSCAHRSLVRSETEPYFGPIRQLTHGGTNAEAYWSFKGDRLTYQHQGEGTPCDQIFVMKSDGTESRRVSDGRGRTTCAFFLPGDQRVLYSSTHESDAACPKAPDRSKGYVWPVYDMYQIYTARESGDDLVPFEPGAPRAYNAEATVCHDGKVVFTSDRGGDLDLYVGQLSKLGTLTEVKQVTHELGYDGGAFFSPDCTKLVWRASRPKGKAIAEYRDLLTRHLVRPGELEIWVADADGKHARQITNLGAASFAPSFTPDGRRVIFSSNKNKGGRHFDLWVVAVNGSGLEQVTRSGTFDAFPMFSPDGKRLAFSSNRSADGTNVFVADWLDRPEPAASLSLDDSRSQDHLLALIEKLSAPDMEGRGAGTDGLHRAETLVEESFRKLGLATARQEFEAKLHGGTTAKLANIVGTWGDRCGKTAPIVIGAHLDHLGHGGHDSLEPTGQGIHPGADDNASGVAAMIEAAKELIADAKLKKRSCFHFVAFSGEEIGTLGSSHYVKSMKVRPKAMLNLDMVGRMEGNRITVFGSDTAPEWRPILRSECDALKLECGGGGDGYGPSDHMPFYIARVPVLHFFTGPHADHHRVSDTSEKINATGAVQTAELVARVAARVAGAGQALHYKRAARAPVMGMVRTGEGRSSRAYLGTIPDYSTLSSPHGPGGGSAPQGGVPLSDTRPGSPAEKAGVKGGDVLVEIIDAAKTRQPTPTLQDFTTVLGKLTPGQNITLVIMRGGKKLELPATVGSRAQN